MKRSACLLGLVTLASLAVSPSAWAAPTSTSSASATPSATPRSTATTTPSASATSSATATPSATPAATPGRSSVGSTGGAAAAASSTPPVASAAATSAIAALTSAHPELGAPTGQPVVVGKGFKQPFANADVYYSDATGAHFVAGPFRGYYDPTQGTGAQLGFPVRDQYLGSQGAEAVNFEHGVYASAAGVGVHSVYGPLGDKYLQLGATDAALGLPSSDPYVGATGAQVNRFQHGMLLYSPETGAHEVRDQIWQQYAAMGYESGVLGLPTTDQFTGVTGAAVSNFQHGTVLYTPATGAHEVYGSIYGRFAEMNYEFGALGLPISGEYSGATGARVNKFQGGMIVWTPGTGAHEIYGSIFNRFAQLGYESGTMGVPTSGEYSTSTGARANNFGTGAILWTPSTGANEVYGSIYGRYGELGYDASALGVPTSGEYSGATGARVNKFQGGMIVWTPGTGAHEVYGSIFQKFAQVGYESGPIGVPTSGEYSGANGSRDNTFTNGMIVWTPAGGAHAVIGAIYREYANRGYEGGSLGLPLTDAYAVSGGTEQKFQNGTVTYVNGQISVAQPTATSAPAPTPSTQATTTQAPLMSSPNAYGNYYEAGSCAWYAYDRRSQLGAPISTLWGNAGTWPNKARADGYTVDHTPQVGAVISTYGYGAGAIGHAMVVEKINADGSFVISQMDFPNRWQITYRTFLASDAQNLWFIH